RRPWKAALWILRRSESSFCRTQRRAGLTGTATTPVTVHRSLHLATLVFRTGESMAGYNGVDYIDFDSQLNDEEKLVRQTARQFVENEVIPIIEKHSREGTFPMHLVPQLGELGFFGANLHGYGCAGMSNVAY